MRDRFSKGTAKHEIRQPGYLVRYLFVVILRYVFLGIHFYTGYGL